MEPAPTLLDAWLHKAKTPGSTTSHTISKESEVIVSQEAAMETEPITSQETAMQPEPVTPQETTTESEPIMLPETAIEPERVTPQETSTEPGPSLETVTESPATQENAVEPESVTSQDTAVDPVPSEEAVVEPLTETEPNDHREINDENSSKAKRPRMTEVFDIDENQVFQDGVKTFYVCETCDRQFTLLKSYYIHKQQKLCQAAPYSTKSRGKSSPNRKREDYLVDTWCSLCRESYKTRSSLQSHYNVVHTKHTCTWCQRNFLNYHALLIHQRSSCKGQSDGNAEVIVNICVCPNCRKMFARRAPPGSEPLRDVSTRALCLTCVESKEEEMKKKVEEIGRRKEAGEADEEDEEEVGEEEKEKEKKDEEMGKEKDDEKKEEDEEKEEGEEEEEENEKEKQVEEEVGQNEGDDRNSHSEEGSVEVENGGQ